jgi:hypothetical protein
MKESEIESKILTCHGKMMAVSIAKLLDIKVALVYSTFRKYDKRVKGPYDTGELKKRSKSTERICKPYKSQLW